MKEIIILNIETSANACSVALGKNGKLLDQLASESAWKHSKELTLLIDRLMKRNSLDFSDLHAVAVSSGPGSYTGLRVGVSAAKAIGYAKKLPLIGIDTLKIIAAEHINHPDSPPYIIPMIDARRDEVYFQLFNNKLESLIPAANLILDSKSFADLEGVKGSVICGNATEKAQELIKNEELNYISSPAIAQNMVFLSFLAYENSDFEDLAYFRPFYLKPPNITKSKKPLF